MCLGSTFLPSPFDEETNFSPASAHIGERDHLDIPSPDHCAPTCSEEAGLLPLCYF